jgi:hypothetical protein
MPTECITQSLDLSEGDLGNIPTTWSIALTGDYNGDGMSDLLWRDTSGNTSIWSKTRPFMLTSGHLPALLFNILERRCWASWLRASASHRASAARYFVSVVAAASAFSRAWRARSRQ